MLNLSSFVITDCSKGNNAARLSSSEFRRSRCRLLGFVLELADVDADADEVAVTVAVVAEPMRPAGSARRPVSTGGFNDECSTQPVTPCPVTPCPVTPCPVTPGTVTPCPVTPCPVTPCPVTPCPVTPCPVTPCPVTPCPVTPCPVTPGAVTPGAVTPGTVTPGPRPDRAHDGSPFTPVELCSERTLYDVIVV